MNKVEQNKKEIAERGMLMQEAENAALDIELINNVMVQTIPQPMGFATVMQGIENDTFVIPSFQRVYRWTEVQVEELAISLVRGMPIPPIYGFHNRNNQIVILDGQQRLISLYLYYTGKRIKKKRNGFINAHEKHGGFQDALKRWELEEKTYKMKYIDSQTNEEKEVDITYEKLLPETKRIIDWRSLNIILITVDTPTYRERTTYKIFANLNKGGIPLSPQELRNGIFTCSFYNMLHEINETNSKWRSMYGGVIQKEPNKESKDVELLLKLCAYKKYFEVVNEKPGLKIYKKRISNLLDVFSEEVMNFENNQVEEYRDALQKFFDCVQTIDKKNKETLWPCLFAIEAYHGFDIEITKALCQR